MWTADLGVKSTVSFPSVPAAEGISVSAPKLMTCASRLKAGKGEGGRGGRVPAPRADTTESLPIGNLRTQGIKTASSVGPKRWRYRLLTLHSTRRAVQGDEEGRRPMVRARQGIVVKGEDAAESSPACASDEEEIEEERQGGRGASDRTRRVTCKSAARWGRRRHQRRRARRQPARSL